MVENIEDLVMKIKFVQEHWDYRLISVADIIRNKRGILNLSGGAVVGLEQSRRAKRLANQRIIEEYFVKIGLEGWEVVGQLDSESLPYNGMILVKKRVPIVEDKEPEVTVTDPDYSEEVKNGLYRQFERETQKNAVWNGKETKVLGQMIVHDPPKKFRRGANGVYDIPRDIIKSIPGLNLVEMYRIRAWGWCCGSGGGVKEAYPDFAIWTARERLKEAKVVGAEAIVSACPSCNQIFKDAIKENGEKIKALDIIELVQKSI